MPKQRQSRQLDKTDLRILATLQQEGRLSNVALARSVNLSPTPCLERVRRLEREGFIKHYSAVLNPALLGAGLLVFVEITLQRTNREVFREFRKSVTQFPEVLDCHLVSGNFDYLIKARVPDMKAYRNLLGERLLSLPGVSGSRSYVVMEELKETLALPIDV
ncbi:MAG: Lrp/AsnC ligand binding domain-containing protein [Xanthomonadales bacterium]|nr:Lrp/AsnC ligand binding domain-containing protein [Xanthomonadales bacterium]